MRLGTAVLGAAAAALLRGARGSGTFDVFKAAADYTHRSTPRVQLDIPDEVTVAYALDAGADLETTAFSTIASLSSVVHNTKNATALRFVFLMTMPEEGRHDLYKSMCNIIDAAVGNELRQKGLPLCATYAYEDEQLKLKRAKIPIEAASCDVVAAPSMGVVTFVFFPSRTKQYPRPVARVLELLCCSQRRYRGDRPELARSLGNHARFFAHLALLPLGVRRALFLDADTLTRADVSTLFSAPLTPRGFVGAARRCASRRAAYKPRFKFKDALLMEFGLKSESMHINAGVLLMDLHEYCRVDMVGDLSRILEKHVAGPALWHQGNNQPPFTIAAASHLTFVHPSWNVRPGPSFISKRACTIVVGR